MDGKNNLKCAKLASMTTKLKKKIRDNDNIIGQDYLWLGYDLS